MKTIWIEDDYLIELALTGKDDLLMEVATCKEKLSYYELYIASRMIPVIRSLIVNYLLSQMRVPHHSYLRALACIGINLREIARVHPALEETCKIVLQEIVKQGSSRLEKDTPEYRKHWLVTGGDGYDVYVIDEWKYNSCKISDWNE